MDNNNYLEEPFRGSPNIMVDDVPLMQPVGFVWLPYTKTKPVSKKDE